MCTNKKILPLIAIATLSLVSGCLPPGGGGSGTPFKLEFDPVTGVFVNNWGIPQPQASGSAGGTIVGTPNAPSPSPTSIPDPLPTPVGPPTYAYNVTIAGRGLVNDQEGEITLNYLLSIDGINCAELAVEAQQQNRTLLVEGIGSVVVPPIFWDGPISNMGPIATDPVWCGPQPGSGGGSAGGGTSAGGTTATGTGAPGIADPLPPICYLPPTAGATAGFCCPPNAAGTDLCVKPPVTGTNAGYCCPPPPPPPPPCPPPITRFYVNADKLTSCSLGGPVILPPGPTPSPSPVPAPVPL
jgi:hypothetical protein